MMSLAYAALCVFTFALPWENLVVIPGIGTISRVTGLIAFALALFTTVISGRFRRWHPFHISALLFVSLSAAFLMIHAAVKIPIKFGTYVQLAVVLWIVWELAPTRQRLLGLMMSYVFGAYVLAFNTILVYRSEAGIMHRFVSRVFDANEVANLIALALPMAWYLGMTYRKPFFRWVCRGFLLVGVTGIGLTGSRGGMLAGIVALMIVPLTMTKLSPGKLAMGIFLLCISGGLAIKYLPETVLQRLATTQGEVEDGSLGGRVRIWKAGAEAFVARPVFGYGTGSFPIVIAPILGIARASHNSFLSVLVEEGIVGFTFYIGMFVAVFLAALNLPALERRFALITLATLFVAMLPLPWEDNKPAWLILAALLGLAKSRGTETVGPVRQARPRPVAAQPWARRSREPLPPPVRDATA